MKVMELELYNFKATCINVVDGDTADLVIDAAFKLTTTQRVRLLGIDTPERNEEGYEEAKLYLRKRILNKDLVVKTYKSDSFGRYLAVIFVDGENVNEEMLDLGLALRFK